MGPVDRERGQSLSEIGLLLVVVVLAALAGLMAFGGAVDAVWANSVARVSVAI